MLPVFMKLLFVLVNESLSCYTRHCLWRQILIGWSISGFLFR